MSQKHMARKSAPVTLQERGAQSPGTRPLPFRIPVGVGPGERRHSVAEHDVGVVKYLLHLHGPVGAPPHIIPCSTKAQ